LAPILRSSLVQTLLKHMTLAQLKKASKKWNPHRTAFPKEAGLTYYQSELADLILGALKPTAKVEKPPRQGGKRGS
jgi:hypothetical protein